jgi:hypothetical protein
VLLYRFSNGTLWTKVVLKLPNTNFNENSFSISLVVTCGQQVRRSEVKKRFLQLLEVNAQKIRHPTFMKLLKHFGRVTATESARTEFQILSLLPEATATAGPNPKQKKSMYREVVSLPLTS